MQPDLKGVKVAVLGGDAREIVLVSTLSRLGAHVRVVGLPVKQDPPHVSLYGSIDEALADVQAVILPVPGILEKGNLYCVYQEKPLVLSEALLVKLPPRTPVFVGFARPMLKDMVQRSNVKLITVLDLDEVAILNSIPSAEGAVQMAMENTDITIHNSKSFVLGFGRTGASLARLLQGMGAKVTVVARSAAHRARVYEMGMEPLSFPELPDAIARADIIFNTVPALVLNNSLLSKAREDAVIIDVASPPGGTDFEAAARLGIKALLAPGLPGKVAPKTAGQILSKVIPSLLAQELERNGH
ncbi:dipicolinate synthase subunit DpsA [Desulforamulus hydrothermalis]|uniref:Dipicolinate synthase, A chain n=1 Tax=Desulforamulus hydrothermalis Lam5 = DSM 18033 TaxID=1121428 RepID=K8E144_9FIRM|nr:dipicolinate synthase subunit DpsA [Desulforamulus hydrothermalis]CCO09409.1 Dipicolinate synthase, A chain [Desulforamulus hydrothermalis Lam5 = DSM 18033]SHH08760.1 dipicolinate synthase subunit A [Desulforamulus hydrothermalis Lam5 = DSM 18033]